VAPSALSTPIVDRQSAPSSGATTRLSPAAMPASMTARCVTDLSGGHTIVAANSVSRPLASGDTVATSVDIGQNLLAVAEAAQTHELVYASVAQFGAV